LVGGLLGILPDPSELNCLVGSLAILLLVLYRRLRFSCKTNAGGAGTGLALAPRVWRNWRLTV
jgi:hypothetical protein